jgi:ABC-2 type transport system permease protein
VRTTRLLLIGIRFHVKSLTLSVFFLLTSVFMPLLVATVSYYMFKAGGKPGTLFYASLGAAVYGIWSSTLFGSGGAIQWQRWQGTLELIVSAPAPFILLVLPLTIATSSIGVYSLISTLLWGRFAFGIPFHIEQPLAFVVAVPATILGLGLLGLLFASTFVLYRNANALSNMLEFPVWLATGVIVPLSLLPGWTSVIGWVLAPTWGFRAVRNSVFGGPVWPSIGMCFALSAVYFVIAAWLMDVFEKRARERATLSLV